MTGANRAGKTSATIRVDQFVAAAPEKVWRLLTEPELMRLWWVEGDVAAVVGHQFTLDMPGYGKQPCKVLEVDPPHRFVYTFTAAWTDGFAKTGSTNLDQTVVTFTADSDVSTGTGNRTFTFSSSGFTASTFAVGQSITLTGSSSRSLTGIVTSWGRNRSDR